MHKVLATLPGSFLYGDGDGAELERDLSAEGVDVLQVYYFMKMSRHI